MCTHEAKSLHAKPKGLVPQASSCSRDLSFVIANPFIGSLIGFLYFCAGSSSAVAIYAKLSNPHYYPMWVGFSLQRSNESDAVIGFFRQFQAFLHRMKMRDVSSTYSPWVVDASAIRLLQSADMRSIADQQAPIRGVMERQARRDGKRPLSSKRIAALDG